MTPSKIEELEKFESLVRQYVAPYYLPLYGADLPTEKFIDNKVLYYLKLGLNSSDIEKKIEKKNKLQKECEENMEKERLEREKLKLKVKELVESPTKEEPKEKSFLEKLFN